ncbi:DUF4136 domain-containing protein [Antarcticibacterium sp. 1MA-6-2]|uniref:DUF4136 domain-containing protein n=1 Tax=Antarcticibacterium sp. 1MA-6-2 TaxID=2908210 RepID=UPI001F357BFC|nr:DUF4136 domain-containing protein [Antarcticibacterium sp. 1MA-6-2]UJH89768.1 DUF4136 domain-containing protein [Antarcticibacterium sp. 1MA-6-2]
MKIFKYFALLAIVTSCNTPKAVFDYDEKVDFSELKTYGIYPDLVSNLNQLDEQRLLGILSEEMAQEGFTSAESPQIYVNFYTNQYETASRNSLGVGVGGGGGNMGVGISGGIPIGGPETYLRITFDFIDANSDSLIWQAIVDSKFNLNASPQKREEQLRAMVEEALEGYPPKK